MKFILVVFFAFAAVASSKHVELGNKNLITEIIKAIIENNRGKLENLTIPSIDLKDHGLITDLIIQGAEKFSLDKLDAAGPLSVDISNATISLATGSATANLNLTDVEIPEIGLIVNGEGSLSGSADTLFLTVAIDMRLDGLVPQVEDFSNLYISIGALQAKLTGVDNEDNVNETVNAKLLDFLNSNLVLLAEKYKAAIIEGINKGLSNIA